MLTSTTPITPATDLAIDLSICIFGAFDFIYLVSVPGPMTWWINGLNNRPSGRWQGIWELVGIILVGTLG